MIERRAAMRKSPVWIVCEQSGHWAAAMRTEFARSPSVPFVPRLLEVRSLTELTERLVEQENCLGLIEVRHVNLAEVLKLLSGAAARRPARFVALLDRSLRQSSRANSTPRDMHVNEIVDALWEAGAAEVIETPRHLSGLIAISKRVANADRPTSGRSVEGEPIEDWALSFIPWQDTPGTLA
jgi:hypothetical protein